MSWFDILKYIMTPGGEKFVLDIDEFKKIIRDVARPLVLPEYVVKPLDERKRKPYVSRMAFTMSGSDQVPTLMLTFRHASTSTSGESSVGTTSFHFTLRRMWEEGDKAKLYPVPTLKPVHKAIQKYYVVDIRGPSAVLRELKENPVSTTHEFASEVVRAMIDIQTPPAPIRGTPIKQPQEKTQEEINRELEEANYDPSKPNVAFRMEGGKMRRGPKAHLTPTEQKRKDDLAAKEARKKKIGRRGR